MDWLKDRWKDFLEKTDGRDIVIWGSEQTASEVVWLLEKKRTIRHVVDSNLSKIGNMFGKYIIEHPDEILKKEKDIVVLICSQFVTEISSKLKEYGINEYYSAFYMIRRDLENEIVTKLPDDEKLHDLKSILSDDKSKQILDKIILKREKREIDYSDIMTKTQYLLDEFFSFTTNEVYIDAGAYDGGTVIDFMKKVGAFDRIYAFEADSTNYCKMNMRLDLAKLIYSNRIQCLNMAVTDYNGTISFEQLANESSKVVSQNDARIATVNCTKLDTIIDNATYIKMDIEGSEMSAIKGAQNLIRDTKPKLAISIYHRPEDLWEIPLFIHALLPEYKLHIRHHAYVYYDTVLYASI